MVNYKHQIIQQLTSIHKLRPLASDEIIVTLHDFGITTKSLENIQGIAYAVPAGNTLTIFIIIVHSTANTGNYKWYSGDTDNATTNLRLQLQLPAIIAQHVIPCDFEITSGKYLTANVSSGTIPSCIAIGVLKPN